VKGQVNLPEIGGAPQTLGTGAGRGQSGGKDGEQGGDDGDDDEQFDEGEGGTRMAYGVWRIVTRRGWIVVGDGDGG